MFSPWEPDAVVIACNTGSVHGLAPLRAQVEPMVFGSAFARKKTTLTTCTLGYRAGVIGAGLLAQR